MSVRLEKALELVQELSSTKGDAKLQEVGYLVREKLDDRRLATSRFCQLHSIERLLCADGPFSGRKLWIHQLFKRKSDLVTDVAHWRFVEHHASKHQHRLHVFGSFAEPPLDGRPDFSIRQLLWIHCRQCVEASSELRVMLAHDTRRSKVAPCHANEMRESRQALSDRHARRRLVARLNGVRVTHGFQQHRR